MPSNTRSSSRTSSQARKPAKKVSFDPSTKPPASSKPSKPPASSKPSKPTSRSCPAPKAATRPRKPSPKDQRAVLQHLDVPEPPPSMTDEQAERWFQIVAAERKAQEEHRKNEIAERRREADEILKQRERNAYKYTVYATLFDPTKLISKGGVLWSEMIGDFEKEAFDVEQASQKVTGAQKNCGFEGPMTISIDVLASRDTRLKGNDRGRTEGFLLLLW